MTNLFSLSTEFLLVSVGLQSVLVCAETAAASSNDASLIERIMFVVYYAVPVGLEELRTSFKKQRNKETMFGVIDPETKQMKCVVY